MSLSVSSRRRFQTAGTSNGSSSTARTATSARFPLPPPVGVRKQHSFIEPASKFTAQQRGYLSRGLSVGRSIENIRQKLYPVSRQPTLAVDEPTPKFAPRVTSTQSSLRPRERSLAAWSSTSSLLKPSLDHEPERLPPTDHADPKNSAKADKNRINLNIVLAQTIRATNEQEPIPSDIDSATESGEQQPHRPQPAAAPNTQAHPLSVSPTALTVQRRPPLVRAMSAPVRGLDENSKSVIAASKRSQQKLRRRKIFTRTASSVAGGASPTAGVEGSSLLGGSDASSKKTLGRTRSVVAPDVITLVSLLSSEGSDSEREENNSATSTPGGGGDKQPPGATQRSPQRRAPLLRKTGKSDSYPPTFQLASKEYSHMIRRGSIAPLAARIRANRPPTAPPVSIFLSEGSGSKSDQPQRKQAMQAQGGPIGGADAPSSMLSPEEAKKENNNNAANCSEQQDHNYPPYVRSIKERECWKLFQKMCAKGVSVSYDTVLRGMLTPTEFRHFQKQREQEEARVQQEAEAAEAAAAALEVSEKDSRKMPAATAIERLSESLLQSK
ncbi:uncharacterized protein LOC111077981 isoform X2 [Drosophila obscura]|uniref:uncharacterized protein LOC111077981 isoform X2 n=1 Tax=Drosophila obscura TaxID=7282 RepID=UPI001BB20206|nr:uncharacterized protein LOC111077981 isoform X2 [Drosophila obscura]